MVLEAAIPVHIRISSVCKIYKTLHELFRKFLVCWAYLSFGEVAPEDVIVVRTVRNTNVRHSSALP